MTTVEDLAEPFRQSIEHLPAHVFADPPAILLGGNETTIYGFSFDVPANHPFSGPLVVRIFNKAATDPQQYLWEAAAHNALVGQGFPVPRILMSSTNPGLGGPWLIMERVAGKMLGSDALEMPWGIFRFPFLFNKLPQQLARLHARLHAIDPAPIKTALSALPVESELFTPAGRLQRACALIPERWSAARLAGERLRTQLPETEREVICHGDLHPLNVMVEAGDVAGVLDWGRICFAEPEYDLGAAFLLLRASVLNLPNWVVPTVTALKQKMARRFLANATRDFRIDQSKLRYYIAQRAFEELVLHGEGLTPEMGQVGGWNFDMLSAVVREQTDCVLQSHKTTVR